MSIKDLLSLADDKLHEVFSKKPHDPVKAREKVLAGIDRTKSQFGQTEPVKGRKWFRVNNNVVELTLPLEVGGKRTLYIPGERFDEFLTKFRASVHAGDLDKEIEASLANEPAPRASASSASSAGTGRSGWSEERRARYNASVAARKAAKA